MPKSSILIVPGAFAIPEFFDPIVNAVAAKGYEIRALHLPSVGLKAGDGREGNPPAMYDDAAFIAKEAEKLLDQGQDVTLIAHSYGGVPATESLKGLGKDERQKQGKTGGIIRLGYIAALVPAVGTPAGSVLAGLPEEQSLALKIDEKGWMYPDPISKCATILLSDLPQKEGELAIEKFARHSSISFGGALTHAGYKDVPVSYLICEDDQTVPVKIQRNEIELVEKESGSKVDVTSISTGHCPHVSAPQKVADWILDVVRKA